MAQVENNKTILKFVPPRSIVHYDFWHKYAEIKIDIDRLDESGRSIFATLSMQTGKAVLVEIACNSFNEQYADVSNGNFCCKGTLLNSNTMESFKESDKNVLLKTQAVQFYRDLMKAETLQSSTDLFTFFVISFADLKTYKFYYWFAFPAPTDLLFTYEQAKPLPIAISEHFRSCIEQQATLNDLFFIYHSMTGIKTISEQIQHQNREANFSETNLQDVYFCVFDMTENSDSELAGWHVRQILAYLMMACPRLAGKSTQWIRVHRDATNKLQFSSMNIILPEERVDPENLCNWVGWQANENGRYIPRVALLADTMSPKRLAENAINLNLKLMKWRLVPSLDLEAIVRTKCLLFGAGTLGCNVARSLMAWGITTITFVDCGKVSLSNPVRQSLYRYEDAVNGGKPKASTAADRLREINPSINAIGFDMKVPMPGHPIGTGDDANESKAALVKLIKLIQEHDVLYLLTDSRESRWLPSMLAAFYGKLVVNAALGFDSYLVMRHGYRDSTNLDDRVEKDAYEEHCPAGFKMIKGFDLGCYFCNDIVAPGNSMKDRTLDQQCTVTRPAVSNMAAGLAVELMVSLIHHPKSAPAFYRMPKNDTLGIAEEPEGILGTLPHSIRGNINTFQSMITATERYRHCVACSDPVLSRYSSEKDDFIIDVLNIAKHLEETVGLNQLMSSVDDDLELKMTIDFEDDSSDES
ncbi:ubiquitin-like modifier-activating enzyme ATG7 [Anopheles ziemanni]|uniref:ubiquitin-like modifier-activating enzyme ATG7 n=1 Tax=Anopheles ziemanni TaxID=345580 RepID=UPI00265F3CA5|nr:ubiquitin-like modifier-activating enzyme ATG7 [Anopheles ziemanni]